MNRIAVLSLSVLVAAAGCRSTKPGAQAMVKAPGTTNAIVARPVTTNAVTAPVVPPPVAKPEVKPDVKAPAPDVEKQQKEQVKALEKALAERRAAQDKLDRQMEDLRKQLLETVQTIRDVKLRADVLTGIQMTNAAVIASIEDSLKKLQSPPSQEIKSLQDALAKEKQVNTRAAADLAQNQKDLADLRKKLEAAPAKPAPPVALAVAPPASSTVPPPAPAQAAVVPPPAAPAATPTVAVVAAPADAVSATRLVADGKQLLRQNKLADAEAAFQAALAQSPNLVGARVGLAACRYNAGDLNQAKRLVADVLAVEKNNAQALGLKGIIAWREGRNRDAVDILSDALKADPMDAQLHSYMGVALYARERFSDATEELRKAVSLDAQNAEAQYNLSVVLATARTPMLNEARLHYEQALQLGYPRDAAMDGILYAAPAPAP